MRGNEQDILNIPVDLTGNVVANTQQPSIPATHVSGPAIGPSPAVTSATLPTLIPRADVGTYNYHAGTPRLLLRHLVTPVNAQGDPDPNGQYLRPGASTV